jgi:hypothetical protein
LLGQRFQDYHLQMSMQPDPPSPAGRWTFARSLVLLTFAGVAIVAAIVGPGKFVMSVGYCFAAFPLLVIFASGTSPEMLTLPGWLLAVSYALPLLWVLALWLAGARAWDRNDLRAAIIFFTVAAFGVAAGLLLPAQGAGSGLHH